MFMCALVVPSFSLLNSNPLALQHYLADLFTFSNHLKFSSLKVSLTMILRSVLYMYLDINVHTFFSETRILKNAKIFPKYLNVCFYDEGIRILVALTCWRFSRFYSLLVRSCGFNCTPLLLIDLHICFSAILSLPYVSTHIHWLYEFSLL